MPDLISARRRRGDIAGRSIVAGRALRHAAKVLPEHARAHNRALVLQTLFHQGAMSRADLPARRV
jgi:hypothetical protein